MPVIHLPRLPLRPPRTLRFILPLAALPACAPQVATTPPVAAPPALSPIDRCAAAVAALDGALDAPSPGERAGAALPADRAYGACVDVLATTWPRCGDAWRGLGALAPEGRGAAILDACRNVYCLDLPAPQPSLCEGELPPVPADRSAAAEAFFAASATLDGTAVQAAKIGAPDPTLVVGPPSAEPPRLELALSRGPTGVRVRDGDRTLDLPRGDVTTSLDAFLGAAEGRSLAIAADHDLAFADVVAVLDAAKALGFRRIALQTATE